jgi:hypothetical protein
MSTAKWKMAAGAIAALFGLAGAAIAAYGSLPPAPTPAPAPMPAPADPPPKNEPAPKAKPNAELVQDAKDRLAEFERLMLLITEAELLNNRRDIYVAGQAGKEDAAALAKKVAELEQKIEALKARQKYYADLFGCSPPSKLPQAIKQIKEEMKKLEDPKAP